MSTRKPTAEQAIGRLAQYVTDQRAVRETWEVGNRDQVAACRALGLSWTQIGKALRMSKQGAQQGYGSTSG